jgi:hypothetical protein
MMMPSAKRYARAGIAIFDVYGDGLPIYGDLIRCKKCECVILGTSFRRHDRWHDEHDDELGLSEPGAVN